MPGRNAPVSSGLGGSEHWNGHATLVPNAVENGFGFVRALSATIAATGAHAQFFQCSHTPRSMLANFAIGNGVADTNEHG